MLGELRVDHGVLKCVPSDECVAELKQKQDERRPATCVVSPKELETHKSSRKKGCFLRDLARPPDRPILQVERLHVECG